MDISRYFSVAGDYAVFRPSGEVSLKEAVDLGSAAIAFARSQHINKLLLVTTGLTGIKSPSPSDRFFLAHDWGAASGGAVKIACVARRELIDPDKFGVMVARNRGEQVDVFTTKAEALAWLNGGADQKGRAAAANDGPSARR